MARAICHNLNRMANVQIFGVKNSQATRAAERFFKERGVRFSWWI